MISAKSMNLSKMPASCGFPPTRNWKSTAISALRNGLAASNCTCNRRLISNALRRLALLVIFPATLVAQEPSLDSSVEAAAAALTELDSKAQSCLNSLDQDTASEAQQRCDEFLQAVDGELLATYLTHCDTLKNWRDESVTETAGNDQNDTNSLELLVGIEFACGENALQKRTQFVVDTFALLQEDQIQERRANAAMSRRLAELEFQSISNQQRRLLQDSIQQQQLRSQLETQQQWNDVENELIRQQIRNPSAAFPRNQ